VAGEEVSARSRADLVLRMGAASVLAVIGLATSSIPLVLIGLGVAAFGVMSWIRS
jgi:hypothetical protein